MLRILTSALILASVLVGCSGPALSPELTEGRDLYANNCSACHGSTGEGATAPSLKDVQETFPSCDTHIEWVTLGSENWKRIHGDTYGAENSTIDAVMPTHGDRLTVGEIALVASFERIQYGGLEEAAVFEDCGVSVEAPVTP